MASEAWLLSASLDEYLREVVMTLKEATAFGMRHLEDQPADAARAVGECQDILQVIMRGDVTTWVGD